MRVKIAMAWTGAMMLASTAAYAGFIFPSTGTVPASPIDIPDNDLSGVASTIHIGQNLLPVQNVAVTLNINGGFNGDLYAYLVHDNGFAVLLNRVGRVAGNDMGSPDAGFSVTLRDIGGYSDIHGASAAIPGAKLTGTFSADGREVDPTLALNDYTSSPLFLNRTASLNSFYNEEAMGDWTLFIADVSPGGISTLDSWSLDLVTVPEPSMAGIAFGAVSLLSFAGYKLRQRIAAKNAKKA